MCYVKMTVSGRLIRETKTHYITSDYLGVHSWSKAWYRLSADES